MIAEQRKTKIYIAAPFFSDYHKKVVFGIIEELENRSDKFEFFSPFHASQPIWDGKSPAEAGPEARQKVFKGNYVNIDWCDILFAWVGGNSSGYDTEPKEVAKIVDILESEDSIRGFLRTEARDDIGKIIHAAKSKSTDTGVTWEMGYAFSSGTPILAYIDENDSNQQMNLMLSQAVQGVVTGKVELFNALLDFHSRGSIAEKFYPQDKLSEESADYGK